MKKAKDDSIHRTLKEFVKVESGSEASDVEVEETEDGKLEQCHLPPPPSLPPSLPPALLTM